MTFRLVLVRHGEADASVHGRCCGTLDPPLSARGRQQMLWVADTLRDYSVLYSSPRKRALESARLLQTSLPLSVEPRFSEIDFGALEGLTYEEVADQFPDVWRTWMERPTEVVFPGGESCEAFCGRVEAAFGELIERHRGSTAVVVAHGGVNRVVLTRALGLNPQHMFRLQQSYGAMSVVDFHEGGATVQMMNVTGGGIGPAC